MCLGSNSLIYSEITMPFSSEIKLNHEIEVKCFRAPFSHMASSFFKDCSLTNSSFLQWSEKHSHYALDIFRLFI